MKFRGYEVDDKSFVLGLEAGRYMSYSGQAVQDPDLLYEDDEPCYNDMPALVELVNLPTEGAVLPSWREFEIDAMEFLHQWTDDQIGKAEGDDDA